MTFIQIEFLWLFAIVFTTYWALAKYRRLQNWLLVITSAVFYGWVHPWFLILLYGSATWDYFLGRRMGADPEHKKRYLALSMMGNLGMLGYFKYYDFFVDNVITALTSLGLETNLHTLGIFLPVGISFYTFQTMSYTWDIYRGELEPREDPLDVMVFVSFFPQLVAGPVERASRLLPQVETDRKFVPEHVISGVSLAMWGAVKKVCVADVVAPYVDKLFISAEPSSSMIIAATLGFSVQILADFSGYTDIARGTARMLGFELMENFKHPYLSKNPSELWRRWHISFSTWIRDYVYIPFGGSRGGFAKATQATFGAMLFSGLWHGASWNFVFWGGYHAALLTGYRLAEKVVGKQFFREDRYAWFTVPLMYGFTCFGWLMFRETHFDRLWMYVKLPLFEATPDQWTATVIMLAMTLAGASVLLIGLAWEKLVWPRLRELPWAWPAQTTLWAVAAVIVFLYVRTDNADFIYFQF